MPAGRRASPTLGLTAPVSSRRVSWRIPGGTCHPPASGTRCRGRDPPGSRGERGRLRGEGGDAQAGAAGCQQMGFAAPAPLTQVMGLLPPLHDLGEVLRGHALAGVQASWQVGQAGDQLIQGRIWWRDPPSPGETALPAPRCPPLPAPLSRGAHRGTHPARRGGRTCWRPAPSRRRRRRSGSRPGPAPRTCGEGLGGLEGTGGRGLPPALFSGSGVLGFRGTLPRMHGPGEPQDKAFVSCPPSRCLAVPMAPSCGTSRSAGHDKGVFIPPTWTEGLYAPAQLSEPR